MRTRNRLIAKQTRVKNQIKAMVRHFGITFPEEFARRHWSAPFIAWLQEIREQGMQQRSGSLALGLLLDELLALRGQILEATRAIRVLARSDRYRHHIEHLLTIEGIGLISAMILMTELVDIDRFRTLDRLASFVGLVPGKHASGDSDPSQSLTNRRCAHLFFWV